MKRILSRLRSIQTIGLNLFLTPFVLSVSAPRSVASENTFARIEKLDAYKAQQIWSVVNGSLQTDKQEGLTILHWSINAGQTSLLGLRPEHSLFNRLRYY